MTPPPIVKPFARKSPSRSSTAEAIRFFGMGDSLPQCAEPLGAKLMLKINISVLELTVSPLYADIRLRGRRCEMEPCKEARWPTGNSGMY
jgi:hypothetical protein